MPTGVIELLRFRNAVVRIRRVDGGTRSGYGPYVIEQREPGKDWRQWGAGHHTVSGAQWQRFTVWGGPRPEGA